MLDAGDVFMGTLFYDKYKSAALAPMVNRVGYDAIVLGKHEFDDGPQEMAKFLGSVSAPVISRNFPTCFWIRC